jgi:hypothetical protein
MALITVDDFVNKFELTLTDFNSASLTEYIERYETVTLVELFGKELYDLWAIGIAATDPIYEFLRDPFIVQLESGKILNSRGVNDTLLGVVYFYWSRDIMTQRSSNGSVQKKGENSENVSQFKANIQSRWDEAIRTYQAIQDYIIENDDVYPTYLGTCKTTLQII